MLDVVRAESVVSGRDVHAAAATGAIDVSALVVRGDEFGRRQEFRRHGEFLSESEVKK